MKWYRLAKPFNPDYVEHPDFIGFHCQRSPRSEHDDVILADYARDYFVHILDALPNDLRDRAMQQGLMEPGDDYYSEEFDQWSETVEAFLRDNGIRWIFTSQNRPLEDYGDHCYYVLLPDANIISIIDDPGVNDAANAYVYDAKSAAPQCFEIPEDEDGYDF